MNKTVNGATFCASCYKQASEQANGNEELGFLAYEFLHYEWAHPTEEQQAELTK